ncbi:endocuticle structural glycoprotein SgAbd-4-like isoform X1 [Amphibalanus amphitrite]|uniref:endocuticle structural glycoprotein SgAbd-4-like isoform X1 n=1 Tax=Amphibalanus amphitrite TaxID=1232801 RepID=UPI001C902C56|nr:endocuticle structural glycoprotein SgAbd-4-like isoform X1 [Amphibalanus amphitrite]
MKLVVVLCLATLALAQSEKEAKIVNHQYEIDEDGTYNLVYQTSNDIEATETGKSYPGDEPETGNFVRSGSYSYVWEGVTYTVNWQADENGYFAEGDHIPKK